MADPYVAFASSNMNQILDLPKFVGRGFYSSASSIAFFLGYYGLAGAVVWIFGSRDVWRIQMQVLVNKNDQDAMDFKKSAQNESNIIAVASTILAQIAITALSLPDLSQTHWVARASFTFSLVSAIMAVYYATRQYRMLGRCLRADQIRSWIQNKGVIPDSPSAASVLTISAPNMLLSTSLNSFLIGLGVYLGLIWTRNLDEIAGAYDSRAVFITYVVGLAFCYGVYALSGAAVEDQRYVSDMNMFRNWNPQMVWQDDNIVDQAINEIVTQSPGVRGEQVESPPAPSGTEDNGVEQATNHIATQSLGVRGGQVESPPAPPGTDQRSEQHVRDFRDDATRQELLQAFREAARLRQESAKVDERLSRLLERLG